MNHKENLRKLGFVDITPFSDSSIRVLGLGLFFLFFFYYVKLKLIGLNFLDVDFWWRFSNGLFHWGIKWLIWPSWPFFFLNWKWGLDLFLLAIFFNLILLASTFFWRGLLLGRCCGAFLFFFFFLDFLSSLCYFFCGLVSLFISWNFSFLIQFFHF